MSRQVREQRRKPAQECRGHPPHPRGDGAAPDPSELFRSSGITAQDRVVVFGYRTLEHLLALHRLPCRSALVLHPDRCLPALAGADLLWVTAEARDSRQWEPLLRSMFDLRAVVMETPPRDGGQPWDTGLDRLRREGFVQIDHLGAALVASRPSWLRRIV